ncbi:Required for respiratory growth protein 9, mitochondrial [Golovinomyces cichoracearum]|uniref:Required for respiratory growth protein 9, mitochondrial n=1 Tax=Golovinomyces cichoracearum TaxID=62708 RepID=A0A420INQ5_9PEZI|nr:Required for respiratory growth protein 9, mitochondrial [Golovinomyces cichoracearum]
MACRCTIQNLHSFIQVITEVDAHLLKSSKRTHNLVQFKTITAPRLRPTLRFQHCLVGNYFSTLKPTTEKEQQSQTIHPRTLISGTENVSHGDIDDAVVEFLPDQIDRLASELLNSQEAKKGFIEKNATVSMKKSVQDESLEKTPLMDLMQDMPKKKAPRSNTEFISIRKDRESPRSLPRDNLSRSNLLRVQEPRISTKEPWMIEKERIKEKYPNGYRPLKKLSPDAMDGIRALHAQMPEQFTTARLALEFKISPEAIRRILKSKWRPNTDEAQKREVRWLRRGEQIWSRWAELGATPPKRFRRIGIGKKLTRSRYTPDPLPELITSPTRRNTRNSDNSSISSEEGGIL